VLLFYQKIAQFYHLICQRTQAHQAKQNAQKEFFLIFVPMKMAWFLLLCLFFWACSEKKSLQNQETYTGPTAVSRNISLLYSQSASVRIKIRAPTRELYPNGDSSYPDSLYIYMFDATGQLTTTIVAQKAFHSSQQQLYTARGGVVVENLIYQQKLETPVLNYNEVNAKIYSDTVIKVTTPSEILNGVGLYAKQDFSEYKILNPTGIFSIKKPSQD
jgi:LPS export ABC transporter protein LptC